jgi:hypothetical protein
MTILLRFKADSILGFWPVGRTSAISGGAQSARRLLTKAFGWRLQFLQAACRQAPNAASHS